MKRPDQVFRILGDLYDFHEKLGRYHVPEGKKTDGVSRSKEDRHPDSRKETRDASQHN
jgi:hypothetical protein